jgi:hypothetical protein
MYQKETKRTWHKFISSRYNKVRYFHHMLTYNSTFSFDILILIFIWGVMKSYLKRVNFIPNKWYFDYNPAKAYYWSFGQKVLQSYYLFIITSKKK